MKVPFTRRKFVKSALTTGATSGVMLSGWCSEVIAALGDPARNKIFTHGIASGDPSHDGIVLWTRITAIGTVTVSWQLAVDSDFSSMLRQGETITNENSDHTVKIEVAELEPGKVYFYRFMVDEVTSEPGRTRTLHEGHLERLGIAVALSLIHI